MFVDYSTNFKFTGRSNQHNKRTKNLFDYFTVNMFSFSIILIAWASLLLWCHTSSAKLLNHGDWTKIGMFSEICTVEEALGSITSLFMIAVGCLIMVTAMMLPVNLPLFCAKTSHTKISITVQIARFTGYLLPWFGFGIVAHSLGFVLQEIAVDNVWISLNGWAIGAAIFSLAGAYQFTSLKDCLVASCCDSKSGHVHTKNSMANNFKIGISEARNCILLCGPMMLLMFVFFPSSILWIFILTLLMVLDRSQINGISLCRPVGALLLGAAIFVIILGVTSPSSFN